MHQSHDQISITWLCMLRSCDYSSIISPWWKIQRAFRRAARTVASQPWAVAWPTQPFCTPLWRPGDRQGCTHSIDLAWRRRRKKTRAADVRLDRGLSPWILRPPYAVAENKRGVVHVMIIIIIKAWLPFHCEVYNLKITVWKFILPRLLIVHIDTRSYLTSKQSFFLWVMEPQFSQAPFLNFLTTLSLTTPFLYQLSMELYDFCFSSWGRWCEREGRPKLTYQGAWDMYWGICGLMSL